MTLNTADYADLIATAAEAGDSARVLALKDDMLAAVAADEAAKAAAAEAAMATMTPEQLLQLGYAQTGAEA